jgi:hypothetical protein
MGIAKSLALLGNTPLLMRMENIVPFAIIHALTAIMSHTAMNAQKIISYTMGYAR